MSEKKIIIRTVLITGAAGFIGAALAKRLLQEKIQVIGIDNMDSYYDVHLKEQRLGQLQQYPGFVFIKGDLADKEFVRTVFAQYSPQAAVNLAAQAGVRYSITHPDVYIRSNLLGFYSVMEACRAYPPKHLVYASSSSVYGMNHKIPYRTEDKTDSPVSLYAATKKSNELMAHAYSKLYGIPMTGLRFFTVYGPAGRPDMAYFSFTEKMRTGEMIRIFNYGNCKRDFTYIDDIVEGIMRVLYLPPAPGKDDMRPPHEIYNLGNQHPEKLMDFVEILRQELVRAEVIPQTYDLNEHRELLPMQPGDVETTCADMEPFLHRFGYVPQTSLREGLRKFARWYREIYMGAENERNNICDP